MYEYLVWEDLGEFQIYPLEFILLNKIKELEIATQTFRNNALNPFVEKRKDHR
jgi:hypothetical protein